MTLHTHMRWIAVFFLISLANNMNAQISDERLEVFRLVMIERECEFTSVDEGKEIQKTLGWENAEFSAAMLQLALAEEFFCPAGCVLIDDRCPN